MFHGLTLLPVRKFGAKNWPSLVSVCVFRAIVWNDAAYIFRKPLVIEKLQVHVVHRFCAYVPKQEFSFIIIVIPGFQNCYFIIAED